MRILKASCSSLKLRYNTYQSKSTRSFRPLFNLSLACDRYNPADSTSSPLMRRISLPKMTPWRMSLVARTCWDIGEPWLAVGVDIVVGGAGRCRRTWVGDLPGTHSPPNRFKPRLIAPLLWGSHHWIPPLPVRPTVLDTKGYKRCADSVGSRPTRASLDEHRIHPRDIRHSSQRFPQAYDRVFIHVYAIDIPTSFSVSPLSSAPQLPGAIP